MDNDTFKKLYHNTIHLIHIWFKDKKDKGGNDYIEHLYAVENSIWDLLHNIECCKIDDIEVYDTLRKALIVALLHDILEDTECTELQLREAGCDDEIIDAIKSVTRRKDEHNYFDFIKRAKQNKIGRIVKRFDLENNMDIRRLNKLEDYDLKRLKKYWYSWRFINDEISEAELNSIKL